MAKQRLSVLLKRKVTKLWRRNRKARAKIYLSAAVAVLLFVVISHIGSSRTHISHAAYKPLLDTIAKGESSGNYNAHFGNSKNTKIRFTAMSISEVLDWQTRYVQKGNVSNAVGKYQIIQPTLEGLIREMNIDPADKFDESMQDKMAIALLERRGSIEFVSKKLSREQFAHNLAKEWAALPKIIGANPHESYYADDGVNQSTVSIGEIYAALNTLQNRS